mmetsp:Transcript_28577/g.27568  ORF Transcript_28577/g.27568 Transcript_28577/m.27568 type:complete len:237 (-) Transcript_28577:1115-1825(-)
MGQFEFQDELGLNQKILLGNQYLNLAGFIQPICMALNDKLGELQMVDLKQPKTFIHLEQQLRMVLNILFNMIASNQEDESMIKECLDHAFRVEENCFKAIKFSLEISIVPIRKILIIFCIYMKLLFEKAPETKEEWKNLKFTRELLNLVEKESPRFNLKKTPSVEQFYKRHMSNDNPIPQIIVVGILRVLLTTCPNAARNTGGIDLHSEWSSCLNFMFFNSEFFLRHNFQSYHFTC